MARGYFGVDANFVECATPADAFDAAASARAFLSGRGVNVGGEQETKTKKALEFFSKQLKKA